MSRNISKQFAVLVFNKAHIARICHSSGEGIKSKARRENVRAVTTLKSEGSFFQTSWLMKSVPPALLAFSDEVASATKAGGD